MFHFFFLFTDRWRLRISIRCSLLLVALRLLLLCDIHGDGNVHGSNVWNDAGARQPIAIICTSGIEVLIIHDPRFHL